MDWPRLLFFLCLFSVILVMVFRNKHIRALHEKSRPFKCSECASEFAFQDGLSRHVAMVHREARPFKCPEPGCDKQFKQKAHAEKHHASVHEKLKPCVCFCGKAFRENYNLKQHQKAVHNMDVPSWSNWRRGCLQWGTGLAALVSPSTRWMDFNVRASLTSVRITGANTAGRYAHLFSFSFFFLVFFLSFIYFSPLLGTLHKVVFIHVHNLILLFVSTRAVRLQTWVPVFKLFSMLLLALCCLFVLFSDLSWLFLVNLF